MGSFPPFTRFISEIPPFNPRIPGLEPCLRNRLHRAGVFGFVYPNYPAVRCFLLKISLTLAIVVLWQAGARAQQFWLSTYEFPFGPKTSLALSGDTALLVGLTHGVARSVNEGLQFTQTLTGGHTHCLLTDNAGHVWAGSEGMIYRSEDAGLTWDSVNLGHDFAVVDMVRHPQAGLFAVTGELDNALGYVGGGVYFSGDEGTNWTPRNEGLGSYTALDQVGVDRHGRLYLSAMDEYLTGNGGLFISDDLGITWQHIPIQIDGKGVIENGVKAQYMTHLEISPDDTLYLGVMGTTGSAGVRLNLRRPLADVDQPGFWEPAFLYQFGTWWMDVLRHQIHFAVNGDRYTSVSGSQAMGGTYFADGPGHEWEHITYGLGFNVFGLYGPQHFAETRSGKLFMVQWMDERVYWTNRGASTPVEPVDPVPVYRLGPNPSAAGGVLRIEFEENGPDEITGYDLRGSCRTRISRPGKQCEINLPHQPGLYVLQMNFGGRQVTEKVLVR